MVAVGDVPALVILKPFSLRWTGEVVKECNTALKQLMNQGLSQLAWMQAALTLNANGMLKRSRRLRNVVAGSTNHVIEGLNGVTGFMVSSGLLTGENFHAITSMVVHGLSAHLLIPIV